MLIIRVVTDWAAVIPSGMPCSVLFILLHFFPSWCVGTQVYRCAGRGVQVHRCTSVQVEVYKSTDRGVEVYR